MMALISTLGRFATCRIRCTRVFLSLSMVVAVSRTAAGARLMQVISTRVLPYSRRFSSPIRAMVASSQASSQSRLERETASHTRGLYQCSTRQMHRKNAQM